RPSIPDYALSHERVCQWWKDCTRTIFWTEIMPVKNGYRMFIWATESSFSGALRRAMDINLDDLPFVIYACFVLHNYCEAKSETISEQNVSAAIAYDREFQPPTRPPPK
ncbi:hypothetical protein OS493_040586, partial [Desmophyllum pertusum]